MSSKKDTIRESLQTIVAVTALVVSLVNLYINAFYKKTSISAVVTTFIFGQEQGEIKYTLINTGTTNVMLQKADAWTEMRVKPKAPSSDDGFWQALHAPRPDNYHPSEKDFPILLKPGEMKVVDLYFETYPDEDENGRYLIVTFDCLDAAARNHSKEDRFILINRNEKITENTGNAVFGISRPGISGKIFNKTIQLVSD